MSTFGAFDDRSYESTRAAAQRYANEYGQEIGLERNDLFKTFALFMLPKAENRCGHELRCEVIRPETTIDTYAITTSKGRTMHTAPTVDRAIELARRYLGDLAAPVLKIERLIERADSARWVEVAP